MNYYKVLQEHAKPISLVAGASSYGSQPSESLDPTLFSGDKLRPAVRDSIHGLVSQFLSSKYQNPDEWMTVWLAGSGVSYNWEAEREPADLDCLITLDFNLFRMCNVQFVGFSNQEIANQINEELKDELHSQTKNYLGKYDLTFFVNVSENPMSMRPYAAYSITNDSWIVEPTSSAAQQNPEWDTVVGRDKSMAEDIVARYSNHLYSLLTATDDVTRRNSEVHLMHAIQQGAALFDTIHEARGAAFTPGGEGYEDFNNYRWQMGKKSGVIPTMKKLKKLSEHTRNLVNEQTYGVELPTAEKLIRRAAMQNIRRN